MKRIAFIIPYFGRFNSYFPLWIKSCACNADVADFFVITDILYDGERPENVRFIPYTWKDLVRHIQSFYDFKIALAEPYGLCDYKCAYGEIFSDFIKGYSHWAYGDNDLIWGRWTHFLPADWENYDKMGDFGHLTIVKNNDEMNHLYRYKEAYKIAFADTRNLFFDEQGFNTIVELHTKRTFSFKIADCNPRVRKLTPITALSDAVSGLFRWKDGILSHVSEKAGLLNFEEVMYIHFLKRSMATKYINGGGNTLIIHDINIDVKDTDDAELIRLVNHFSSSGFYFEYWKKYLSINQLRKTIRGKLNPTTIMVSKIRDYIVSNK